MPVLYYHTGNEVSGVVKSPCFGLSPPGHLFVTNEELYCMADEIARLHPSTGTALMGLPHCLSRSFNLLGEVFLHRALVDKVAEEVPEVLDVLSPRGLHKVVACSPRQASQ